MWTQNKVISNIQKKNDVPSDFKIDSFDQKLESGMGNHGEVGEWRVSFD